MSESKYLQKLCPLKTLHVYHHDHMIIVCFTEELPSKNVAEAQKLLMHSVQCCDQLIEQFNNRLVSYCDNDTLVYIWLQ